MSERIERTPSSYTKVEPLFNRLKKNAYEHGYRGFFGVLTYSMKFFINFYLNTLANLMPYSGPRVLLHRLRGVHIGNNVLIGNNVIIDNTNPHLVSIGDGVSLAGNNLILAHSRPLEFHGRWFKSYTAPVIIENNVWITVGVIILAGVRVGEGSVITANSLVSKDIPPLSIAGGTPALVMKKLE